MRAKTEHLRRALYDLEPFSLADKRSFFVERDWVADDPIRRTHRTADPKLSRYALRFFEFGTGVGKVAIVQFRLARPRREPRRADGSPVASI
jgi:hypothetical protein